MIDLTDKGAGLNDAIISAGHTYGNHDGVAWSSDDVAVQAIHDNYDPVPYEADKTKSRIIIEASKRAAEIYPFIDPESEQAIALYEFASDLYLSTISAARESLSGRLLQFKNIHDKAQAAIVVINSDTDWKSIRAYDVVNGPGW